jgi:hypothetical protein
MRQADDPDFQSFLDRVRAACVTQDDIARLNSKVVTSIFDPFSVRRRQVPMCPAFCLTDYKVQGKTLPMAIGTDGSSRG